MYQRCKTAFVEHDVFNVEMLEMHFVMRLCAVSGGLSKGEHRWRATAAEDSLACVSHHSARCWEI